MSEEARRVEVITSVPRRRRWSVAERIRLVEETLEPGMSVSFVARQHGISPRLLFKWRQRMAAGGREAVRVDDAAVAGLLATVRHSRPTAGTHWTARGAAEASAIPKSSVHRYFELFGIQPHRSESFKLSSDPQFVDKVRDIVGLYLNPPDHTVVLGVDERSQVQALRRTRPVLPVGFGYVDGITHDYKRHGTKTLFAALDVANGQVPRA